VRILYHHRTASKDGQAVHIEELIAALRELGHEVRVVAPDISAAEGTMGAEAGWVQRLKTHLPKALYELLELAYSFHAYRRLRQAVREFRPDFIYERYNLFLLAGLMLKRRLGLPLLLEVNSPLAEERGRFGGLGLPWLARWAEGRAWRGADAVLPVTRVLAGHVVARGVPEERIAVIPNGINRAHFAEAPSPAAAKERLGLAGALVLGFTGFVRDWHGVDRVIRWMAGPAAPFEYLALGKAVIAPRQPNIEEVLTHEDNALLFDAAAPGAMEQSLARLCADADLRNRLAAAAAATIGQRDLTWLGNARRVTELASRALGQPAATAAGWQSSGP